ncbi:MAG: chemotaxis protein CheW [Candidatus Poribacteria bacterium]
MKKSNQYIVFNLDRWRYGLHLSYVARVVRVVEITPLPKAPEIVLGVVNVHGEIIPVFNIRHRLRLPEREIELSDKLIIARTSKQTVALLVNAVSGVIEPSEEDIVTPENIMPSVKYSEGVVKLEGGLILLIHDLDKFISFETEDMLD